ncbi:CatB-related O-acetyltransferase [uncultured Cloacibacillus sp.]|uniref:CatB-related O-acetyltransferase n=1 Tax=uncultured Cloacibacillus sp. TaxID=889794 RepID=UPI0026DCB2AD|nr:CatB-related O-acetyltransferase [uncultured Cloacibacillus sp.]
MIFRYLLSPIKQHIKLSIMKAYWRKQNQHNLTMPAIHFPLDKVNVGKGTYGQLYAISYGNPDEFLTIGCYCSIADQVKFLLSGGHDYERFSNYPFSNIIYKMGCDSETKGPIIVEDDVWIGYGAIILSGVTLGKGCVIGAGSVVTKNVPPYAIYAGGRIIKYRFPPMLIDQIMDIDFSAITDNQLSQYRKLCKDKLTAENIAEFISIFKK